MKILIVSPYLPYPPDIGASIRIFNLIKRLSRKNEVELMSTDTSTAKEQDIRELKKYCEEVYIVPWKERFRISQTQKVLTRFFKGEPFIIKHVESFELQKLLFKVTGKKEYDIIQFEHSHTANNCKFIDPKSKAVTVLSMHNIASIQYYRMYMNERNIRKKMKYFLTWFPMLKWEPKMARLFDKLIVVSESDKIFLQYFGPDLDVSVIPNGVDTNIYRACSRNNRERNILFVGSMDYEPNVDAVSYFYNDIFPLIRENIPNCSFTIVGKNPPAEITKLDEDPDVTVKANVNDVRPYYREALVSAVALRSGGGTRLKILESMALGTPIVSTSIGCEGLEVTNRKNILIANNPRDFADRVIELFISDILWSEIAKNGRMLVEEKYDWDHISVHINKVYVEAVAHS